MGTADTSERGTIFCPECGTLAFPESDGSIRCPNGRCSYVGAAKKTVRLNSGEEIDTSDARSKSAASSLKHLTEVIDDSEQHRGVLTTGMYVCPKCEENDVYAELKQTRASDEPETRILSCKSCNHGWREYCATLADALRSGGWVVSHSQFSGIAFDPWGEEVDYLASSVSDVKLKP